MESRERQQKALQRQYSESINRLIVCKRIHLRVRKEDILIVIVGRIKVLQALLVGDRGVLVRGYKFPQTLAERSEGTGAVEIRVGGFVCRLGSLWIAACGFGVAEGSGVGVGVVLDVEELDETRDGVAVPVLEIDSAVGGFFPGPGCCFAERLGLEGEDVFVDVETDVVVGDEFEDFRGHESRSDWVISNWERT